MSKKQALTNGQRLIGRPSNQKKRKSKRTVNGNVDFTTIN
tara:strand:- start:18 stop:137 length:120 start_codon:yes stop_codon:yes gene_type:complete